MDNRDKAVHEDVAIGQALLSNKKAMPLLELLFYDRLSYTQGDSHQTAFREGQRDVVGYLRECIKLAKQSPSEEESINVNEI